MSDITKIKAALSSLEDLAIIKASAAAAYRDAIKFQSIVCEVDQAILRKVVAARIDDKVADAMDESEGFISIMESL